MRRGGRRQGLRKTAPLRIYHGGAPRATSLSMGAGTSGYRRVSEIYGHAREYPVIVELFFVWKRAGNGRWPDLTARELDAFLAMEEELVG